LPILVQAVWTFVVADAGAYHPGTDHRASNSSSNPNPNTGPDTGPGHAVPNSGPDTGPGHAVPNSGAITGTFVSGAVSSPDHHLSDRMP